MPLVSVLIPCHKAKADIALAVSSLAAQTHQNFEIILISDDGEDYRETLANFTLPTTYATTGKTGSGASNAKNIGFALAKGEAILVLDSDDYLDSDFFEKLMPRTLAEGACMTPRRPVDYDSHAPVKTRGLLKLNDYRAKTRLSLDDFLHMPFGWQTIFRKDMVHHLWETEFRLDADLLMECLIFERIGHVPFEFYQGYNYRIRPGSICHSDDSHILVLNEYRRMLTRLRTPNDGLNLSSQSRGLFIPFLEKRIANVEHYLRDKASGTLAYEPNVIGDMLLYPL